MARVTEKKILDFLKKRKQYTSTTLIHNNFDSSLTSVLKKLFWLKKTKQITKKDCWQIAKPERIKYTVTNIRGRTAHVNRPRGGYYWKLSYRKLFKEGEISKKNGRLL